VGKEANEGSDENGNVGSRAGNTRISPIATKSARWESKGLRGGVGMALMKRTFFAQESKRPGAACACP